MPRVLLDLAAGQGTEIPKSLTPLMAKTAEELIAVRGDALRLKRLFRRTVVPMVMVDDDRRYVEVNQPARIALGLGEGLDVLRVDDLTPPNRWPALEIAWAKLREDGYWAGPNGESPSDPAYLGVTSFGLANALPGRHVLAFAPSGWPTGEFPAESERQLTSGRPVLTPRELEVVELAAEGRKGPAIADALMVSDTTVKSHFTNIYAKLGVHDRAGAVATAIRLGLIA
jgi:DNA-binding CsgD family transcriptional regulator